MMTVKARPTNTSQAQPGIRLGQKRLCAGFVLMTQGAEIALLLLTAGIGWIWATDFDGFALLMAARLGLEPHLMSPTAATLSYALISAVLITAIIGLERSRQFLCQCVCDAKLACDAGILLRKSGFSALLLYFALRFMQNILTLPVLTYWPAYYRDPEIFGINAYDLTVILFTGLLVYAGHIMLLTAKANRSNAKII
ncbi:hypothetical protein FJU08_13235 [Martelella alba]|uniref:Uncharacterized protein n=1 Tax=Martelella alba TaxID=2590451 RepID=A0A506U9M0_9HYPH|nr:hypothetical protein [Martelella alba]TPW29764.1 hypothetical protein FJU08_13235 [Martelella alba]